MRVSLIFLVLAALAALAGCPPVGEPFDDDDVTFVVGPGDDDDAADDDDVADDDDSTPPMTPTTVTTAAIPACGAPAPGLGGYVDGLPASGIDFVHATDPSWTNNIDDMVSSFADVLSLGLVAADLDDDGHVDLFFTKSLGASAFYWGYGDGTFSAGETVLPEAVSGMANVADFDGDGDLDLLVGGRDHLVLYRNDGARTFTDVTSDVGLIQPVGFVGGAAWADWDQDGDLDLYVGGYIDESASDGKSWWEGGSLRNVLYRQDNGVFVDVTEYLHDFEGEEDGAVLHAVWRDLDHDGDLDLVQVNDFGDVLVNTFVWENEGADGTDWAFTERGVSGGVPYIAAPMGCLAHDVDGDGWEDLWFSDFGRHVVLRSTGPGFEWIDVSAGWMLDIFLVNSEASWSVLGTDLDGDGDLELMVPYGPIPEVFTGEPIEPQEDRFLVDEGAPGAPDFQERQSAVFPAPMEGLSRAAVEADLNEDGVPDLVVPHIGEAPSVLLGRCTANRRLALSVRDPLSANRFAIGARVTVTTGGLVQTRTQDAGGRGSFSGSEPTMYFGLGSGAEPVRVEIAWPGGGTSVLEDVCSDCRVTVSRAGE